MTEGIITLSHAELDRVSVIRSIISRRLTQAQAAQRLKLSVRQVKRLTRAYRTCGAAGMASKRRGRCPGNALSDAVRRQALAIIRAHYIDFGPTFAHEKLTELHACHCSVETLRKWMIKDGLWLGKQRKKAVIHQSRPRRPRLGELVQIDGSPHDWFEGRGPRCTLIVFIDDATSRLLALRFAVTAHSPDNAHREVLHSAEALTLILCLQHRRKLSKNLTIAFHNTEYPLQGYGKGYRLRGATITVCEDFNGAVTLLHKGKALAYRIFQQGPAAVVLADEKTVRNHVEQALHRQQQSTWKPAPDHPWRHL